MAEPLITTHVPPGLPAGMLSVPGDGLLSIAERPVGAIVQVAWWPDGRAALDAALATAGLPPSPEPGTSTERDGTLALDAGPGRMLLIGTADLVGRVEAVLDGAVGTVTDLSQSRVRIALDGSRARDVLTKGTSVDLRDRSFTVGAVAWMAVHGMGIVLHRRERDGFDVLVYRGFARALAEWLNEAARPDGLPTA